MILEIGRSNYYGRDAALKYLEVLSQFRNFNIVVFVDKKQRFLACMSSRALKELLGKQRLGEEFIEAINEGDLSELLRYPGLLRYTIHPKSTNAEALDEMMRQNLKSLLVIDENDHLVGVVEREQVLSRMMLSLVK